MHHGISLAGLISALLGLESRPTSPTRPEPDTMSDNVNAFDSGAKRGEIWVVSQAFGEYLLGKNWIDGLVVASNLTI